MTGTVWLFGLPCSGKTTIAGGLVGADTVHLDGDYLRDTVNTDLGFSKEDRTENIRRAAGMAEAMNQQGKDVVASFITPYQSHRELVRDKIEDVTLVHVDADVETCKERDVKGMYEQAENGEIEDFTGVSDPFEEPVDADLTIRTDAHTESEAITQIRDATQNTQPRYFFVGRWQPMHDGHRTIIDSCANNGKEVLIGIRNTELSEDNPFTAQERQELIEEIYGDHPNVETTIVPDVDTVAVGRDVGYSLVNVPEEIEQISGTETRQEYDHKELLAGEHLDFD